MVARSASFQSYQFDHRAEHEDVHNHRDELRGLQQWDEVHEEHGDGTNSVQWKWYTDYERHVLHLLRYLWHTDGIRCEHSLGCDQWDRADCYGVLERHGWGSFG